MGIRKCALENSIFCKLKKVYDNREQELLHWKAEGKKVIGALGVDIPDELIIAADMLPIRIYAQPNIDMTEANKYLEYAFDPVVRAQFEKIVDGTYNGLVDKIAISNSTDVLIRVYLYLRELKRIEPEKEFPDVEFIDWMFTRNRMHQERNEFVIKKFKERVETWAGHNISEDEIKNAARVCNENRQLLRELNALRQGPVVRISGSEMLVIIGSAFFMERSKHTHFLKQLKQEVESWPVINAPRVFYTGSMQFDTKLYELIEETGCVIVGEDHDWGNRFFDRNYNMEYDSIRAIVDCYMLREFSSKKAFVSQRVEALNREVKSVDAQGVIFYTNVYEDAASWDYPSQKKSLEQQGIKTAHFSKMNWPLSQQEENIFQNTMQLFTDQLKEGR